MRSRRTRKRRRTRMRRRTRTRTRTGRRNRNTEALLNIGTLMPHLSAHDHNLLLHSHDDVTYGITCHKMSYDVT